MPASALAERAPASALAERAPASAPALVLVPVGARWALAEELQVAPAPVPVPLGARRVLAEELQVGASALAELLRPVVAVRLQVGCLHPAVVVAWPPQVVAVLCRLFV